jgi:hypothetical protein
MKPYAVIFDELIEDQKVTNVRTRDGRYVTAYDAHIERQDGFLPIFTVHSTPEKPVEKCSKCSSIETPNPMYIEPNPNDYMYALECPDCMHRTKFFKNPRVTLKEWQQSKVFSLPKKAGDNERHYILLGYMGLDDQYDELIEEEDLDGWCC